MSQIEFDQLLQKYLAGSCSLQEEKVVLEWYRQLVDNTNISITESEKAAISQRIYSELPKGAEAASVISSSKGFTTFLNPWYKLAIAASFIALVVISAIYFVSKKNTDPGSSIASQKYNGLIFTENNGKKNKSVQLEDGSVVTLYPHSTLFYPKNFSVHQREVFLEGNAFFEIAKNAAKHFIVHSGGLVTEVLGTSFEIVKDAQTNKVQVSVVTGKVAVYDTLLAVKTSPGDKLLKGIVITPNQKIIYNPSNNKYITSLVDEPQPLPQNADSLEAKFVFDEAYLSEVVQPIETLYGINIEFEKQSVGNCH
ncbi:MAG TPA: FecR family protein, partial [Chitinophagaceae bacterium]|nr:FecR family protein [Chitinophagaceae bacterium]